MPKKFNYKQWWFKKKYHYSKSVGFRSRNTEKSKKLLNLIPKRISFLNMQARYPRIEVSVYEARSTKCVRQCCHFEGFLFCFVLVFFFFFLAYLTTTVFFSTNTKSTSLLHHSWFSSSPRGLRPSLVPVANLFSVLQIWIAY